MALKCSAEQLAEAVTLWSVKITGVQVVCKEREDTDRLKPLDLILSTTDIFRDGFDDKFKPAYDKYKQQFLFSKQNFINYLKPRCRLLAQNNCSFDLFLTCAFVSSALVALSSLNNCCHFSRVSCKLLTNVLEEGFSELLNTDSGWDRLMSYCKKVHDAVLPSKENRPVRSFFIEDSEDDDSQNETDSTDSGTSEEELLTKIYHNRQARLESSDEDDDAKGFELNVAEEKEENKSICSAEALDTESSDEEMYWSYITMRRTSICKRISEGPEHLANVFNLLKTFVQKIDPWSYLSDEFEIAVSDDEEIEKLEQMVFNIDISECKVKISENVLEFWQNLKKEEEGEKSEVSSQNSENINETERLEYYQETIGAPQDELRCELCYLKMRVFKNKWLQNFSEKYSNYEFVTDLLKIN